MIIEDRDGDELEIFSFRDRVEVGVISKTMQIVCVVHLTADEAIQAAEALYEHAAHIKQEDRKC